MAKGRIDKGIWADLAQPQAVLAVRVTPAARQERAERVGGVLRIAVTAPPEDGKANTAVAEVLATALGIAPTRLRLVSGATGREKRFRIEG